jgi:hypothetical protein
MENSIYPNSGFGDIRLGQSLYEVLKTLHNKGNDNGVEFKYNNNMKIIIVYLSKQGINLIFDKFLQVLFLIEIKLNKSTGKSYNSNIEFEYKNEIIKKFNFKSIYNRYFGPTYKGYYDLNLKTYFLSYCGITFKFENVEENEQSNETLNTINKDFNCTSIFIYQNIEKDSNTFLWNAYTESLFKILNKKFSLDYVKSFQKFNPPINDLKTKIKIKYAIYSNFKSKNIKFKFLKQPNNMNEFILKIGKTTMQDMIKIFGFPNDSILKRKSRSNSIQMKKFNNLNFEFTTSRAYLPSSKISNYKNLDKLVLNHGNIDNYLENCTQELIKIHNYFDLGFDVIYDLNITQDGSNLVSRIILHENNIESTDFLKYEKFTIFYYNNNNNDDDDDEHQKDDDGDNETNEPSENDENDENLSTFCKLSEIKNKIKFKGLPIFVDKKEYNIQEDFELQFKETDRSFEFVEIEGNNDSKDKLENNDLNYWGLTNFDGCNSAIFEALTKSEEICTITIHE